MLDRTRYALDPWKIVEHRYSLADAGHSETIFAVGNGYLGVRGHQSDASESYERGTFVNGFYETWPIFYAEHAHALAEVGQTIVNLPDATLMRVSVDGEEFSLEESDSEGYERELDMSAGVLRRRVVWRTRSGVRIALRTERLVSFVESHLMVQRIEVEVLDAVDPTAPIRVDLVSGLIGPYDRVDTGSQEFTDPRRAERLQGRVLLPGEHSVREDRLGLSFRTAASGLGIGVVAEHVVKGAEAEVRWVKHAPSLKQYSFELREGESAEVQKFATYYDGSGDDLQALVDMCERTLDWVVGRGLDEVLIAQRTWLEEFWQRSDVIIDGKPELQQAVRWCVFQIAQAAARGDGRGVPAKGVSGSGYSGHYFWDTEIYVLPFLAYTRPAAARDVLQMRIDMLPAARRRAAQMALDGALFPWRTINGEEASAYYPAGTAQFHIDADVAYAVAKYVRATGDRTFLLEGGIDLLVETARMWVSLGFWREQDGRRSFHIHGVTGPDEYTAVVSDNLYTNVMARFNLDYAAEELAALRRENPEAYAIAALRLGLAAEEAGAWRTAAAGMHIGFDERHGVHPQDALFLEREVWDFENTPRDKYPLLLNFHPLVIYRHQVLKQADVVLALFLQSDQFTAEEKLADFEYYDPLTTGDSTLSGVVQAIIAAEVGYSDLALRYFTEAISVDLADLHKNAADGVHVASAGGVWSALVYGFAGMRDVGGELSFDPRLPADWEGLSFSLTVSSRFVQVRLEQESLSFTLSGDEGLAVTVRGEPVWLEPWHEVTVPLEGQGPRRPGRPALRA